MPHSENRVLCRKLPWANPLAFLPALSIAPDENWVLLYSGMRTDFTGRYSFLAINEARSVEAESFAPLAAMMGQNAWQGSPLASWFGYLGYGLKNSLETLTQDTPSPHFPLPALWMAQYRLILVFDHDTQQLDAYAASEEEFSHIPALVPFPEAPPVKVQEVASNMTSQTYRQHVATLLQMIRAGDVYEANLTRKFFGTLTDYSPIHLFKSLCTISPSPYSALLKKADCYILSSSPEQFLTLSAEGHVSARPIKGSAPRYADPVQDAASKNRLVNEKNQAENLMIVDLMRNDFARGCIPGSVKVKALFETASYSTIHHLFSTIEGQKREGITALELIQHCFPPGSMTGAPKIQAMELCSQLEQSERGVYSGCIGRLGEDGSADLSVVIRTLLLKGNRFEFQVGGAIVADSDPEDERQETLNKARAIALALGISLEKLAEL